MVETRKIRTKTGRHSDFEYSGTIELSDGERSPDELADSLKEANGSGQRHSLRKDSYEQQDFVPDPADFEDELDDNYSGNKLVRNASVHHDDSKWRLNFQSDPETDQHEESSLIRVRTNSHHDAADDEDNAPNHARDVDKSFVPTMHSGLRRRGRRKRFIEEFPGSDGKVIPYTNPVRRSDRNLGRRLNLRETGIHEEKYHSDSTTVKISFRAHGAREVFKPLPLGNEFLERHCQQCEVCGNGGSIAGQLLYCQGCSLAYHKNCLGPKSGRGHLVTKIAEGEFVVQCRRCINTTRKKDDTAPDQAQCQECNQPGISCGPFKEFKTALQEQREREANGGIDPIVDVDASLINNANNVLFRCMKCWRAFHFHHLAPKMQDISNNGIDDTERANMAFSEYSLDWKCKDCYEVGEKKISSLVAWRPMDMKTYNPGVQAELVEEDEREYLVKWEKCSYFRVEWMPGPWIWGVTAPAMRNSFLKKDPPIKMTTEEAVPEEYLRIDIVLDVRFNSIVGVRNEDLERTRILDVKAALIKYKGLGYEDAVWERVPKPKDGQHWSDFSSAYYDWVRGRYIRLPNQELLNSEVKFLRSQGFSSLEKSAQSGNVTGGQLMKYQLDGLNWLYHQWHSKRNGILADEMGLGKTIQIIAFLAMMIKDHGCYPYLIIVPNSTCPNWRRELKQWAPSIRVVTYYGSSTARKMAYEYELFPENSNELACHVVITSFETAIDKSSQKLFKTIPWQGLIVDEGQRLKNDKSNIHQVLTSFKVPFRLLLSGTPLQNNARELFNLLQFLDENINAVNMEREFAVLSKEKVDQLHAEIRPYILRRTKAQVLTFLPQMAQIIVPVTMTVLQKKLYKSILDKNPELLRALYSNSKLKPSERSNMNNILIQLRKCVCHPFIYSKEIEERTHTGVMMHRNLVEASSKLQLLNLLLPKLKEHGHRVLIFSQLLEMLDIVEDFLDGLEMRFQRLDGRIPSLEKQKRIDEFNAKDSPLFAFLLSTRAGGVGINLATADTVIILDPDFNPHQDVQALSRAHRIGQTKKVLCFQLMTRGSVEEKIMQMSRKKMALDHVVVEQLDTEDLSEGDVESILRHGAAELFDDNGKSEDIHYDEASVEKLLDRSLIEQMQTGEDNSTESQFGFARVWANDDATMEKSLDMSEVDTTRDPGVWGKILKEREKAAAEEAAARFKALGRGKRTRNNVNYNSDGRPKMDLQKAEGIDSEALLATSNVNPKKRQRADEDSDTDWNVSSNENTEDEEFKDSVGSKKLASLPLDPHGHPLTGSAKKLVAKLKSAERKSRKSYVSQTPITINTTKTPESGTFYVTPADKGKSHVHRSQAKPKARPGQKKVDTQKSAIPTFGAPARKQSTLGRYRSKSEEDDDVKAKACPDCYNIHGPNFCPLQVARVDFCDQCDTSKDSYKIFCPHRRDMAAVDAVVVSLECANVDKRTLDRVKKYVLGAKAHLSRREKKARERIEKLGLVWDDTKPYTYEDPDIEFQLQFDENLGSSLEIELQGDFDSFLEKNLDEGAEEAINPDQEDYDDELDAPYVEDYDYT